MKAKQGRVGRHIRRPEKLFFATYGARVTGYFVIPPHFWGGSRRLDLKGPIEWNCPRSDHIVQKGPPESGILRIVGVCLPSARLAVYVCEKKIVFFGPSCWTILRQTYIKLPPKKVKSNFEETIQVGTRACA